MKKGKYWEGGQRLFGAALGVLALVGLGSGCGSTAATGGGPVSDAGMAIGEVGSDDRSEDPADGIAPEGAAPLWISDGGDECGLSVTGIVVSFDKDRPLPGLLVWINGHSVTTGDDGTFTITTGTLPYDIWVEDVDGIAVTVVRGLTRTNARIPYHPSAAAPPLPHSATVDGDLAGGGNYPLAAGAAVDVYFFSGESDSSSLLGGGFPPYGPDYGPMGIGWQAGESVTGTLLAVGTFPDDAGQLPPYPGWFTDQSLTVADGQMSVVDLALQPVGASYVAGQVSAEDGGSITELQFAYRLPIPYGRFPVVTLQARGAAFDAGVPDLSATGASLCALVRASPGTSTTEKCGLMLADSNVSLTVQSPPAIASPADGTIVDSTTSFTWSTFEDGIYELGLVPSDASSTAPTIYILQAETSASFPDLSPLGIQFPTSAAYTFSVAGLGPFASVDDALDPITGLASVIPVESRMSISPPISVATAP